MSSHGRKKQPRNSTYGRASMHCVWQREACALFPPESLLARPIVAGIVDERVVRYAHGSAARTVLAKATLAAPVAAEIVEITVYGNGDRVAALADAAEASFALPIIAGTDEVRVGRNFHRHARTLRLAKTAVAFPSAAIARFDRVGVLGNCHLHATLVDHAIAAVALPASVVPGVHDVGVHWNFYRLARRTLGAKAAIAGPRGPFRCEIRVRRNDHRDAVSGRLTKSAVAFPTIASLAGVVGNGRRRALGVRVDGQCTDQQCRGAEQQADDLRSVQSALHSRIQNA